MCREPVFEAFAEDFLRDCNLDKDVKDRLLSIDWYDSHVNRSALTKLFKSGVFTMFTENDCTDILAMPDGGGIKTLKTKLNSLVDEEVEKHTETWFGTTPASRSLRRLTLLRALGEAWSWFRENHSDLPHRIAFRTGQVFHLSEDRVKQFEKCSFRGYVNSDMSPKNPFAEKEFGEALREYKERNNVRREKQKLRAAKKLDKAKKKVEQEKKRAERKKKQNSKQKVKYSKKKIKRERDQERESGVSSSRKKAKLLPSSLISVKVDDEKDFPHLPPLPPLEVPAPVKLEKSSGQRNFQKDAFDDRRVLTEVFLNSLNLEGVNNS